MRVCAELLDSYIVDAGLGRDFFFSHHVSREAQNLGAIGGSRIPSRLFERGLTSSAVSAWCA